MNEGGAQCSPEGGMGLICRRVLLADLITVLQKGAVILKQAKSTVQRGRGSGKGPHPGAAGRPLVGPGPCPHEPGPSLPLQRASL